jgi:hypothetical protein
MHTRQRPTLRCGLALLAASSVVAAACGSDPDDPITTPPPSGKPAHIRLTTAVDMALPGASLDTVVAVVTDESDGPVASAAVTWSVETGGGSIRVVSSRTDTRGMARAIWTLGPTPGDNVLAASATAATARLTAIGTVGFPASALAMGGTHACALTRSGDAYCWGTNRAGQLGIGTTDPMVHPLPARVSGGLTFTSVVAGTWHSCGLTTSGDIYCWGANPSGQIGSAEQFTSAPTRVTGAHRFSALAAGAHHTCGLTTGGTILCWGDDTLGQLGIGRDRSTAAAWGTIWRATPESILGELSFVALAASWDATCAVATTGQTYCWGGNAERELGTATGTCRMLADPYYVDQDWDASCSTKPVPIDSRIRLTSLTGNAYAFCGLTTDDALLCWGSAEVPPTIVPGARVTRAWSLGHYVCGLGLDTAVSCWAIFDGGGRVPPLFGDAVVLVDLTSFGSSCGLTRDVPAVAYCWGNNVDGELGDGTTTYRASPVPVGLPRIAR